MGQGKIPWYTHRLMHRKRVTCELHDSYFRLMTIKHAIPKIEWAIELLYNSVRTWSQWVGDQMSWRQDVVKKATTLQKGSSGPPVSLGTRPVGEKMLGWEYVPERLGPQAPGWATQETRTTHGDVRRGWGDQYVAVFVQSPAASHTQILQ